MKLTKPREPRRFDDTFDRAAFDRALDPSGDAATLYEEHDWSYKDVEPEHIKQIRRRR